MPRQPTELDRDPVPATNPYDTPATAVDANQTACASCGAAMPETALDCPACGARARRPVSKTALLLLTFFLGGLGAHKFYLGQWVQGILYLLFFLTGIPALVALIEFIVYACTSSARLNQKYRVLASPLLIAGLTFGVFVAVIGTLAAIAIPAYQDYAMRTAINEARFEMYDARGAVESYYQAKQQLPVTGAEITPPAAREPGPRERYTSSIRIARGGAVVGALGRAAYRDLTGQAIIVTPRVEGDGLKWDCGVQSEAMLRFVPADCRKVVPLP